MMQIFTFAVQATVWLASNYTAATFGTGIVSVIFAATMSLVNRSNEPQAFFGAPVRRRKSWTELIASGGLSFAKNIGLMLGAFCFFKWPLTSSFMTIMWTGIIYFSGLPSTFWVLALMSVATLLVSALLADLAKGLIRRGSNTVKKAAMSIIKLPFKLLIGVVCIICRAIYRRCLASFKPQDDTGYYTAEEDYYTTEEGYASETTYFTQCDGFWSDEDTWDGYDSDMTSENYEDDYPMSDDDESTTIVEPLSPRRSPRYLERVDYKAYY